MKLHILINKNKEPESCIVRLYSSESRANQDYELLADKESFSLLNFDVFPSIKRENKKGEFIPFKNVE